MTKKTLQIFLIFLFTYSTCFFAQNSWTSAEFPNQEEFLQNLKNQHDFQLKKYENTVALDSIYKWRYNYTNELLDNDFIIYKDSLYNFVENIFDEIILSNPELSNYNLRFLISKTPYPNAISIGDGTFIINLGLIRKLDNEDQLAFILCHEISHFYLDHSNQSAIKRIEKQNSKEYEEEIEAITSTKYGKYNLLKAKLRKNLYKQMSFSRKFEKESDSLGLLFFKNTKYDSRESVSCLKLLDTIDYYKFSKKIDFKKTFNTEKFKFKNRWLVEEKVMFGGSISDDFFERDSIKSHPDSKLRARILEDYLTNTNESIDNNKNNKNFEDFKSQADFEFIKSWVFYENYGRALFFCLKQLQVDEDNRFLINMSSNLLRLIYDSHSNHTFGQHVDRPSSENEKEYNQFLNFIDKISLSRMAELCYHFHLKHLEELKDEKTFFNNYNYFNIEYHKKTKK